MRDLRRILAHPTGKTVMTTIQKFQEIAGTDSTGKTRSADKADSAGNTRSAGKAGTVPGGDGRSAARRSSVHPTLSDAANIFVMVDEAHRTLRTFGPCIDTYTIEQAVQDGATVPIFYESRLHSRRGPRPLPGRPARSVGLRGGRGPASRCPG